MNKVILLNKRPVGKPALSNFKFSDEEIPKPGDGEMLLKTLYVSVDPNLRRRMNNAKFYLPPFELNKPLQSDIIAEVIDSNCSKFSKGDFVSGNLEWKEYQISAGRNLLKLDADVAGLSAYLGVLGTTGITAYYGLMIKCVPKEGETMVVSGAAGAVGTIVGQIGKILGCRVVGIAGTDEKVNSLKSKFNFDEAINYKTTIELRSAIKDACPNGVDIYFDNVGGEISDAVLGCINKHARIAVCGSISLYNATEPPLGPRIQPILLNNSAMMKGFIVSDYSDRFQYATSQLKSWLKEKKLTNAETIVEGFDYIPQAFIGLFEGENLGKMIVKLNY